VQSRLGRGSAFTILLPIVTSETAAETTAAEPDVATESADD
jgi:hypothetical protein